MSHTMLNMLFAALLLLYGIVALLVPEIANSGFSEGLILGTAVGLALGAAQTAQAARRKQQTQARQRAQAQQRRQAHYQAVVDQRMAELQGMGRPPRDPRLN